MNCVMNIYQHVQYNLMQLDVLHKQLLVQLLLYKFNVLKQMFYVNGIQKHQLVKIDHVLMHLLHLLLIIHVIHI
jgi:hypothetical protein